MALLRKDEIKIDDGPVLARPSKKDSGEVIALLGRGSTFEGKLTFEGTVRIDGAFKGNIFSDAMLVVGEGARVDAEIEIGTLVVNGEVRGNVRAKNSVELHAPGRLLGNINTPVLQIERGVIFEGECKMQNLDRPRAVPAMVAAPRPEVPGEGNKT